MNEIEVESPRETLAQFYNDAVAFFAKALKALADVTSYDISEGNTAYFSRLPSTLQDESSALVDRLMSLAGRVAATLRSSTLGDEADRRDLTTAIKIMRAALLLRRYANWEVRVLRDEDVVLGVKPAGQSEDEPLNPSFALLAFKESSDRVSSILSLAARATGLSSAAGVGTASRYRPGTAFIMMAMNKDDRSLDDVKDTAKSVFKQFGIRAVRADDIEHEDVITERITDEIATAEFLFADLTCESPSVYYEVGYAHALGKRVILFRKSGTRLHFDLAHYNCPEYDNMRQLREKLTTRLENVTNRRPLESA